MKSGDTVAIPLDDIDVDYEWNSRSPANTVVDASPETDDESSGLGGLIANVLRNGQKDPVDVRPTAQPFYRQTTRPWSLVAGFRRVTAITSINRDEKLIAERDERLKEIRKKQPEAVLWLVSNLPDGYVLCKIHGPMSEREAFLWNARENSNREQLTPPDTTMMVKKGVEVHGLTVYDLAVQLGKTPGSVSDYVRVAGLPSAVLTHWQKGGEFEGLGSVKRASLLEMKELSKLPAERHVEGYKRLLTLGNARAKSTAWFERAKARARHMGAMIAKLQRDGFLVLQSDRWERHMGTLVGTGKRELSLTDSIKLAAIAEKFYQKEMQRPTDPPDAEDVIPSAEEALSDDGKYGENGFGNDELVVPQGGDS